MKLLVTSAADVGPGYKLRISMSTDDPNSEDCARMLESQFGLWFGGDVSSRSALVVDTRSLVLRLRRALTERSLSARRRAWCAELLKELLPFYAEMVLRDA